MKPGSGRDTTPAGGCSNISGVACDRILIAFSFFVALLGGAILVMGYGLPVCYPNYVCEENSIPCCMVNNTMECNGCGWQSGDVRCISNISSFSGPIVHTTFPLLCIITPAVGMVLFFLGAFYFIVGLIHLRRSLKPQELKPLL